jgi:hypothetical protein
MSSTNIDYQIIHYQGDTFVLEFTYIDENNAPIDLTNASAELCTFVVLHCIIN